MTVHRWVVSKHRPENPGPLTRQEAERLSSGVLRERAGKAGVLLLDFAGTKEVTLGACRTLGPALHHAFMQVRHWHGRLVYTNLPGCVQYAMEVVFEVDPQKQVALTSNGNQTGLLGPLPAHLREVMDLLHQHQKLDSDTLKKLGVKAASKKLHDLHHNHPHLLERHLTGAPWHYHYQSVIPWCEGPPKSP